MRERQGAAILPRVVPAASIRLPAGQFLLNPQPLESLLAIFFVRMGNDSYGTEQEPYLKINECFVCYI